MSDDDFDFVEANEMADMAQDEADELRELLAEVYPYVYAAPPELYRRIHKALGDEP